MVTYLKTIEGRILPITEYEPGCWINVIAPTEEEIEGLIADYSLEPDFIRAALDEEESSRIESEDGTALIIIDIPVVDKNSDNITYYTMPVGIMITDTAVITVCLKENPVISEFAEGVVKGVHTNLKTQFVLHFVLRVATRYLQYLKQIDKISAHVEKELRKSMKNQELIQLVEISKSLVYFSSSLKGDEITMEKMMRGRYVKLYEDDQDLLDDVIIELRQAVEMANIYLNILSGTMDAFASVISNNLNIVMKVLASITLIMSIPTIISGLYGMNVGNIPVQNFWFPVGLSAVAMLVAVYVLYKKKMF